MERLISIVERLGVPVAMCVFLCYLCFSTIERNTQAVLRLDKSVLKLVSLIQADDGSKLILYKRR